jgi:hypothetical protein
VEQAREAALAGDYDRAVALILDGKGNREAAQTFNDLARALYNEDHNLPATRAMLERGIAFAAERSDDEEVKGRQKAMNYNLGSFCWPGWGEADRVPTPDDLAAGKRGAAENLRLGEELTRPEGPTANAHWLVGAYQLVDRQWSEAEASFLRMKELATRAEQPSMASLADGYLILTQTLQKGGSIQVLDQFCSQLKANDPEDGEFFAQQLRSAFSTLSGQSAR